MKSTVTVAVVVVLLALAFASSVLGLALPKEDVVTLIEDHEAVVATSDSHGMGTRVRATRAARSAYHSGCSFDTNGGERVFRIREDGKCRIPKGDFCMPRGSASSSYYRCQADTTCIFNPDGGNTDCSMDKIVDEMMATYLSTANPTKEELGEAMEQMGKDGVCTCA